MDAHVWVCVHVNIYTNLHKHLTTFGARVSSANTTHHTHLSHGQRARMQGWMRNDCVSMCRWTDKWTVHRWMNGWSDLFPPLLPGVIDQPAPPCCIFNYLVRKQIRWGSGALRAKRWSQAAIIQGPHQRLSIAAQDAGIRNWRKETKSWKSFTLVCRGSHRQLSSLYML